MAGPPTGTLTFLFTDIEGSTRLWERHPQAMRRALSRHDEILRRVTEEQHGYVFKTVGCFLLCLSDCYGRPGSRTGSPAWAPLLRMGGDRAP